MAPLRPIPGQVIRYSYLWADEHRRGREEGAKDRPCVVILAVESMQDGNEFVTVLPVTHSPPGNQTHSIEIPHATKLRLGLDDQRSWIVLSEANRFTWPGPDIRPVPGQTSMIYGELPSKLFELTQQRFLTALREQNTSLVPRTE
ncbi:type II toxin-antitoxin system PemK/MazF family toxin [Rhizobium sp. TH2]|uniref:type II toxin-antitoxin system PemK/MazF family toxin n=1 Tax=Rhizobium sp. TH2 TaxID=2775403 RepID=UPI00215798E2|nr:type II toxin-antitoxin system PemK/MazF family toxin [Rhizobium sp. TH2]UVC09346.1 type II toxin-antitoxin system PemK/MazF family toxin [Rhizobium sp. TH2]